LDATAADVERLMQAAATLGVALEQEDAQRLFTLLGELERWNRSYNLTAIQGREAMITHHLLDSLAVHQDLSGARVADVGTGAGFPGLPLALCNRERQFTLIDSSAKKIRFVEHAVHALALTNVTALQARVESLAPEALFDTVVARAFAPLAQLLPRVQGLCAAGSQVLAMKGKWPAEELAALDPAWRMVRSRELTVPGLNEARCVLVLARA
jgi:16S rRNA (guanine527-N7)-methyltransferase